MADKPTPEPDTFQNIVRWAILLFFVYAAWNTYKVKSNAPASGAVAAAAPQPQQQAEAKKDSDCNKTDRYSLFKMNFMPLAVPVIRSAETKPGKGEPAVCGQKAVFAYEYLNDKKVTEKGQKSTVIGSETFPQGVELSLIGMKPGGEKNILVPPQFLDVRQTPSQPPSAQSQPLEAKISLKESSPALPASAIPLYTINDRGGSGRQAVCGDAVSADVTIWKVDGTKLFSTDKPIRFVIGMSELPLGIEHGALGMTEGSGRLVVMPPVYQQPFVKNANAAASALPELPEEVLMVQLENFHIEDPHFVPLSETLDIIHKATSATPVPAPIPVSTSATPAASPQPTPQPAPAAASVPAPAAPPADSKPTH